MNSNIEKKRSAKWRGMYFLTFFISFGYVFLEWLFVVTKPSFLTNVSWLKKLEILLFVSACFISLSLILITFLFLISKVFRKKRIEKVVFNVAAFIPSAILAALILILIDNFTYTIFNFGIIKTTGVIRVLYGIGFIAILYLLHREVTSWCLRIGKLIKNLVSDWKIFVGVPIILIIFIFIPFFKADKNLSVPNFILPDKQIYQLPNIVILTSDGLNADHMSVYGYEKATTPFLDEKAPASLIVENNFNNNARTGGSIISILTGKYPSTTRVIFSPDILRDENSYQHLPGILNSLGYYTAQFGGQALNFNLLQGFDEINNRPVVTSTVLDVLDNYIPGDFAYFTFEVSNRIVDRVRHIFFIKKMDDSLLHLTEWDGNFNDYENLNNFFALIENADSPLFVQMHWLGTHGDYFKVRNQVFSAGKDHDNQEAWDQDFYDDAILEFDEVLRGIEEKLDDFGKLNNTIIVVGSDHGQYWAANERLPLIFLFPQGENAQRILFNGQNLDIAPTLLAYLGIDVPSWMPGESLLGGIDSQRLIYAFDLARTVEGEFGVELDPEYSVPPFYQFGKISVIDCDRFYSLSLRNGFNLETQLIDNYETPCEYVSNSEAEVVRGMVEHLKQNKFNTVELEAWLEEYPTP